MKNVISMPVPSLNFHVWEPCNMRCKFCFATFQDVKSTVLPKGHLPREEALKVVKMICQTDISKITFAGGEPTLCPWLLDMLKIAKKHRKTTMIVTNGSRIDEDWLSKHAAYIDWIAVSIDSINDLINLNSGRAVVGKRVINEASYKRMLSMIKSFGIRLKINTVISSLNWNEDMSSFINEISPERWKIFQVLPIEGQNDGCIKDLLISNTQFESYIKKNSEQIGSSILVPESNQDMTTSYLMIDPAGRFYHNTNGFYEYSEPLLKVGIESALSQIKISKEKFDWRDGEYDWD